MDWFEEATRTKEPERKRKDVERDEAEAARKEIRTERSIVPIEKTPSKTWGDRGAAWRMIKLQRVLDTAKTQGKAAQEVALERYSTLAEFEEALEERQFLDAKEGKVPSKDLPRRDEFKKPFMDYKKPVEPVKSISTIPIAMASLPPGKVLTDAELNKLKALALKAKFSKASNAKELEQSYQSALASRNASSGQPSKPSEIIPEKPRSIQDEIAEMVKEERTRGNVTIYDQKLAKSKGMEDLEHAADALEKTMGQSLKQKEKAPLEKRTNLHCFLCPDQNSMLNTRVIAAGYHVNLLVPDCLSMVPGHCLIVPSQHVGCTLESDDDVWLEIRNFQKSLIRMCAAQNQSILFLEQFVDNKRRSHASIECIPVPNDVYEDAPASFKEALLSAESEWSQHQSVIPTSKGFRKSMIKELAYFHVWFNPDGGLGHVIETPEEWTSWFGREVIAGAMDLDTDLWRRPRKLTSIEIAPVLENLKKQFAPFDWTASL